MEFCFNVQNEGNEMTKQETNAEYDEVLIDKDDWDRYETHRHLHARKFQQLAKLRENAPDEEFHGLKVFNGENEENTDA
jgi:hypothetical protein